MPRKCRKRSVRHKTLQLARTKRREGRFHGSLFLLLISKGDKEEEEEERFSTLLIVKRFRWQFGMIVSTWIIYFYVCVYLVS